jgi:hypothetical protein
MSRSDYPFRRNESGCAGISGLNNRLRLIAGIALLVSGILSAGSGSGGRAAAQDLQPRSDRFPGLMLDDSTGDGVTVATVGPTSITAKEFLLNYAFGPAFTRRHPDSKRKYLEFMVDEKLLAQQGASSHLDTSADIRHLLGEIEGDCATEELYKDDVRSKVSVPEGLIRHSMEQEKTTFEIRWLYAQNSDNARMLSDRIREGMTFDSLFRIQLGGGVTADNRSMTISRFRLGVQNPLLARVLDTLPVHHVSSPVAAPDGFYIVSADNRWRDVVTSETQDVKLHHDIERVLAERQSDSLSDQYVKTLMEGEKPVIQRKAFDLLEAYMSRTAIPAGKSAGWDMEGRLVRRWGPVADSTLENDLSTILVETRGARFTIDDFLWWYRARETTLKFSQTSPQAFFSSLESTVFRMVRDRLLTARAIAKGYQEKIVVRKQVQWWRDKLLYEKVRSGIADSIQRSDSALRDYYSANMKEYRNDSGAVRPFESVRNVVEENYFTSELTKRILHRIIALKRGINVTVNDAALKNVHVEDEQDPRAIDVIAVKNRGIFPRPAFPSIDPHWQGWE